MKECISFKRCLFIILFIFIHVHCESDTFHCKQVTLYSFSLLVTLLGAFWKVELLIGQQMRFRLYLAAPRWKKLKLYEWGILPQNRFIYECHFCIYLSNKTVDNPNLSVSSRSQPCLRNRFSFPLCKDGIVFQQTCSLTWPSDMIGSVGVNKGATLQLWVTSVFLCGIGG